ncbi:MAG: AAA family ATPase [Magnetococcales bacterium]|nr:AAA family ATPase [Magnetococcales bacterium]
MIKRLYISGYKTLVDFELHLDRMTLLLGPNGSGKSAVMECLLLLREFIVSGKSIKELMPDVVRPCFVRESDWFQKIELEIYGNDGLYCYRMITEDDWMGSVDIKEESLSFNNKLQFEYKEYKLHYYNDGKQDGEPLPKDNEHSVFQMPVEKFRVTRFQSIIKRMVIVQPQPKIMEGVSRRRELYLQSNGSNFASWWHHLMMTETGLVMEVSQRLQEVFPGFQFMQMKVIGENVFSLMVVFSIQKKRIEIPFTQLSDGQKCLILLYALLAAMQHGKVPILFIDEPENFLALPEIMPWLNQLLSQSEEEQAQGQCLLISHHPKMINFLASAWGRWLERDPLSGASKAYPIAGTAEEEKEGGLPLSRLVERGWIMDDV